MLEYTSIVKVFTDATFSAVKKEIRKLFYPVISWGDEQV